MRYNNQQKLLLLAKIKEHKNVLFGAFSSSITSEAKTEMWKQIFNECKARAFPLPDDKDFTFIWDAIWQNLKKRQWYTYFHFTN